MECVLCETEIEQEDDPLFMYNETEKKAEGMICRDCYNEMEFIDEGSSTAEAVSEN